MPPKDNEIERKYYLKTEIGQDQKAVYHTKDIFFFGIPAFLGRPESCDY